MTGRVRGTEVAERLLRRPGGATMDDIVAASGGPQYNVLRTLEARGWRIRKAKEGRTTRYYAEPPATPSFDATVTSKGQVTLPKAIRERLGLRDGGALRLTVESDQRIVLAPADLSVKRLKGMLGKPPRSLSLAEMDEAVRVAAVEKSMRQRGR